MTDLNTNAPTADQREEITITAEMIYDCRSRDSLADQSALIHNDLMTLLDGDLGDGAMCCAVTIKYVASEAETYGNDEARSVAERQAERLKAALGAMAYPDDENDATALLQNALCDLRHFADQNGLAFGQVDHTAHGIYLRERGQ
jgi:hypothetical protein